MKVKLIDFGSACSDDMKAHSYIQSRFYRSPEILLGVPYSSAIDLWSLGCICAELHLGLPVWPGQCEYDQLRLITKLLGLPPTEMLAMGNKSKRYFKREATQSCDALEAVAAQSKQLQELTSAVQVDTISTQASTVASQPEDSGGEAETGKATPSLSWRLKTCEEYEQEANKKLTMSKRSWKFTCLEELVKDVPEEMRSCFLEFVSGLFQMDPKKRWSAKQALLHPFVKDDVPLEDPVACTSGMCQPIDANAPSSTTGTPASSPHGSACSTAFSQARQQAMLRSPWHLNSPGSGSECFASQASGDEWRTRSLSEGSRRGSARSDSDANSGADEKEQNYAVETSTMLFQSLLKCDGVVTWRYGEMASRDKAGPSPVPVDFPEAEAHLVEDDPLRTQPAASQTKVMDSAANQADEKEPWVDKWEAQSNASSEDDEQFADKTLGRGNS
ncbi:unnamed protein product [Effrenium voratum]|nr:unnamed protein product [Effrenium voratum]